MTALVKAENICLDFGSTGIFKRKPALRALSDIDLTIGHSEIVAVVGESGSGKSSLGKVLMGMYAPSRGKVTFDGAPLQAGRQLRRRMQMVFQDPYSSLDPRRRIGDQISDGLSIHDVVPQGERKERVQELLSLMGLPTEFAARLPHSLSGGQRQRVSIARAISTQPDFIVADEPISALDISVQAQILRLFLDLRERLGVAIMFITHDLPAVEALCDRVIVLYLGRIMEEGSVSQVFDAPHHPYTRALLAAAPQIEEGSRRDTDARTTLRGDPPSPYDPPSGCVFRTRCPAATKTCAQGVPPFRSLGAGHRSACILPAPVNQTVQRQ
jgi:peptide/nickel transport system ATP-binding protein